MTDRSVFLILLLSVFLPLSANGSNEPSLKIDSDFSKSGLEPYIEYFVDTGGHLTIKGITKTSIQHEFTRLKRKSFNFGVISDPCWVRFTLKNPQKQPVDLVLELGTSTINHADIYIPLPEGGYAHKTSGDLHTISKRDHYHRQTNFSVTLGPGEQATMYLRLQTEAILETTLSLYSLKEFVAKLPVEYFLLGFFYAAFFVAIFYNLFIYFSLRDPAYLLYVLYASSFCSLWLYLDGLGQMFFWPDNPWQQVWGTRFANTLTCLFIILFTMTFFQCRKNAPRLYRLFQILACVCLVNSVMVLIFPLAEYKTPVRLTWLFSMPTILVTAAIFWKRNFKRARYFLIAWLLVLFGAAVFMLGMYGLIPSSVFTRSAWRIASVLEIILLSLALADRINELNVQKRDAQNRLLESERKLKQGLESEVALRTEKLKKRTLELRKANHRLEKLSTIDSLTGLYNRRFFDEILAKEWERMLRHRKSLCLVMCDIDHFKHYNDTHGHQAGDVCLKEVADSIMSQILRSSDVCARYGGEEFGVILPETDELGGQDIIEHIRSHLKDKKIPHARPEKTVTLSFGLAVLVPSAPQSSHELVALADKALYKSKEMGRDRVTVA